MSGSLRNVMSMTCSVTVIMFCNNVLQQCFCNNVSVHNL